MTVLLGIDPGIEGACALYGAGRATAIDIPTAGEGARRRISAAELFAWVVSNKPDHAFIENVSAMPHQGVSSSFRFGRAAGALEAIVACAGVPLTLVAPIRWKKMFGLVGPDKEQARVLAIQKFPGAAHLLKRKKDHQRAESLLIAYYGWRLLAVDDNAEPQAVVA
jgi:hypothetical protein